MKCDRPFCPQTLWLLAAGWFLLALFAGETQLLAQLPPIITPLLIAALASTALGSYLAWPSFRRAIDALPDRWLVSFHLTRFVGVYFLVLQCRGEIDPSFATPAGWGDIAVALGAVILFFSPKRRGAMAVWNVAGLIDILFVVFKAAALRASDPQSLVALTVLPLSFLPTMIVPLIIASHGVLLLRLYRKKTPNSFHDAASPAVGYGN